MWLLPRETRQFIPLQTTMKKNYPTFLIICSRIKFSRDEIFNAEYFIKKKKLEITRFLVDYSAVALSEVTNQHTYETDIVFCKCFCFFVLFFGMCSCQVQNRALHDN